MGEMVGDRRVGVVGVKKLEGTRMLDSWLVRGDIEIRTK